MSKHDKRLYRAFQVKARQEPDAAPFDSDMANLALVAGTLLIMILLSLSVTACQEFRGPQGPKGDQGPQGSTGSSGASLVVNIVAIAPGGLCQAGGQLIQIAQDTDPDSPGVWSSRDQGQEATAICNGVNGVSPTLPSFTPSIAITPCGPNSSQYKEALLGLTGGGVYAEVITRSGDPNTIRNALLPDGGFYDTDDSECRFTVSTDVNLNRFISWDGSSANGSGPYPAGGAVYMNDTKIWSVTYGN